MLIIGQSMDTDKLSVSSLMAIINRLKENIEVIQ